MVERIFGITSHFWPAAMRPPPRPAGTLVFAAGHGGGATGNGNTPQARTPPAPTKGAALDPLPGPEPPAGPPPTFSIRILEAEAKHRREAAQSLRPTDPGRAGQNAAPAHPDPAPGSNAGSYAAQCVTARPARPQAALDRSL